MNHPMPENKKDQARLLSCCTRVGRLSPSTRTSTHQIAPHALPCPNLDTHQNQNASANFKHYAKHGLALYMWLLFWVHPYRHIPVSSPTCQRMQNRRFVLRDDCVRAWVRRCVGACVAEHGTASEPPADTRSHTHSMVDMRGRNPESWCL